MKALKKILACMLAVCFVLTAFAGCALLPGREDGKDDRGENDVPVTEGAVGKKAFLRDFPLPGSEDKTEEASAEPDETDVQGKLIAATNSDYPPYEYKEGDQVVGIDIDIVNEIARRLGRELEIRDVTFDSIVAGVEAGKYDLGISGICVTAEREKHVAFSRPYALDRLVVIVQDGSPYATPQDFYTGTTDSGTPEAVQVGVRIGVERDSTGDIFCSEDPENFGFGEENVMRYDSAEDAVQALIAGRLTAVVLDEGIAEKLVRNEPGLKIMSEPYTEDKYAICIARDNDRLLQDVNKVLANMESDGTIDRIFAKYMG